MHPLAETASLIRDVETDVDFSIVLAALRMLTGGVAIGVNQ